MAKVLVQFPDGTLALGVREKAPPPQMGNDEWNVEYVRYASLSSECDMTGLSMDAHEFRDGVEGWLRFMHRVFVMDL
jgi:hypothetical protein